MTVFLIVINLYGGQPAVIPMESMDACKKAAETVGKRWDGNDARGWCVSQTGR